MAQQSIKWEFSPKKHLNSKWVANRYKRIVDSACLRAAMKVTEQITSAGKPKPVPFIFSHYRIKTMAEFENEFGIDWRDQLPYGWNPNTLPGTHLVMYTTMLRNIARFTDSKSLCSITFSYLNEQNISIEYLVKLT